MSVINDKNQNLQKAKDMINQAVKDGAQIVVLPEMFNCPYDNKYFREYAENEETGITIKALSDLSRELNVHIVGGSIPEIDENNNIFNTCFVFDDAGKIIGKHRKIHLFDIDIKDKITFIESDTLSSGNEITIIDTKFCKIGIAICYDIRFPELTRIMALEGAEMVIVPAAFNMTTGPAHWETLFKSRSLDNQIYMVGASPARNYNSSYIAYGNSIVTSPWGDIADKLDGSEEILISEIYLDYIKKVRSELPLLKHRREDIYNIKKIIKEL